MRRRKLLLVILTALVAFLFSTGSSSFDAFKSVHKLPDTVHLCDGDIILRKGRGFISDLMCKASLTDPVFSHAGVLLQMNGQWMVCHAIGGESSSGGVRVEKLTTFCSPQVADTIAVFRMTCSDDERTRIRNNCIELQRKAIPFDRGFDYSDDAALYCTELVSKVLYKSSMGRISLPLTSRGGLRYVSCENLYKNEYATLVQ